MQCQYRDSFDLFFILFSGRGSTEMGQRVWNQTLCWDCCIQGEYEFGIRHYAGTVVYKVIERDSQQDRTICL